MKQAAMILCLTGTTILPAYGDLLVSDRGTNQVLRFNDATGEFIEALVAGDPATNGGLVAPSALAIGHGGDLLVASQFTGGVLRYDVNTGEFLGNFASQINGPSGLLYDESRDRLYVSTLGNFDSELVLHFRASTGEMLGNFGAGTGASGRTSMTFGPDDQLYVSSFANDEFFSGSVLRFDAESLAPIGTFAAGPGLAGANGLTFRDSGSDDSRSLDVVGLFSSTVVRFDVSEEASGDLAATSSQILIGQGLDFPSDILSLDDGTLLVSNLGNDNLATGDLRPGSVRRFDAQDGAFLDVFLEPGGASGLSQPTDLLLLPNLAFDCNGDGVLDQADVLCACAAGQPLDDLLAAVGSLPGDVDFDGVVQFSDFLLLSANFGMDGIYAQGDLDCDGQIQFADFLILSSQFGQAAAASAVVVPEPSSMTLVSLLLYAVVFCRRRPDPRVRFWVRSP